MLDILWLLGVVSLAVVNFVYGIYVIDKRG